MIIVLIKSIVMSNYIYLLQEREFIKTKEPIYKIGKTRQKHNDRLKQYPKGSKLLLQISVDDCDKFERDIIKLFREKYKWRKDIGHEYFEGNYNEMIKDIKECTNIKPENIAYDLIIEAAANGNLEVLDEYLNTILYSGTYAISSEIDMAAANGHISVLKWFYKICETTKLEFKYTEYAIDQAASNGHINVLEWFYTTIYEKNKQLLYSSNALLGASVNNHINILEWFYNITIKKAPQNRKIELKIPANIIETCLQLGLSENIINWWLDVLSLLERFPALLNYKQNEETV